MRARDDVGAADQHRPRDALVHRGLRRAQHALVLAFGVRDALGRRLAASNTGSIGRAGLVYERVSWSRYASKSSIGRVATPLSMAAFATAGAMRGDEPRIERARDQVVGTERRRLLAVRQRDDVGRLGPRELGERAHRRELHLLVDRRRAAVERAAEDERKAQRIVDLVRIVRAAGADQAIGPRGLRELGPDLRLRDWPSRG